ncbi:hypothetical protein BASA61_002789 [Batrachochytrium salamandrivorans]|nr:hypothetical protein BASA61_002789 [Batrachochytrium salamandrivorans]
MDIDEETQSSLGDGDLGFFSSADGLAEIGDATDICYSAPPASSSSSSAVTALPVGTGGSGVGLDSLGPTGPDMAKEPAISTTVDATLSNVDALAIWSATELFTVVLEDLDSPLATLAKATWVLPPTATPVFSISTLESIWKDHLVADGFPLRSVMVLEHLQFLPRYLLPNYCISDSDQPQTIHTLAIVLMINEMVRLRRPDPWAVFSNDESKFSLLFSHVQHLLLSPIGPNSDGTVGLEEKRFLLIFLIHCFQSLEKQSVRSECLRITNISIWHGLINESICEQRLAEAPERRALWERAEKRFKAAKALAKKKIVFERFFLSKLICQFFDVLSTVPLEGHPLPEAVLYCERFLEFLIDLEAQLPTRRHVNVLMEDHLVVASCMSSALYLRSSKNRDLGDLQMGALDSWGLRQYRLGSGFKKLTDRLAQYSQFPIDDITGVALSSNEVLDRHYSFVYWIQKICFTRFSDCLGELSLLSISNMTREELTSQFQTLEDDILHQLCYQIGIRTTPPASTTHGDIYSRKFLIDRLCVLLAKPRLRSDSMNLETLYPTEISLFDESVCPLNDSFFNTHCLALPKLTLQYLTIQDYILRQYDIYKLHSYSQLREYVEDAVMRLSPTFSKSATAPSGGTIFEGTLTVALPIDQFQISEVGQPMLTESRPSFVKADLVYSVGKLSPSVRQEWDTIRPGDHLLLLNIKMEPGTDQYNQSTPTLDPSSVGSGAQFRKRYGITAVRGCEVCELLGENGRAVDDFISAQSVRSREDKPRVWRRQRSISVLFDANQYLLDTSGIANDGKTVYDDFNVVIRLSPELNNFKAVLETLCDSVDRDGIFPEWLHDLVLGYGDRHSAHYSQIEYPERSIYVGNTFENWDHLQESFPSWKLISDSYPVDEKSSTSHPSPPYELTLPKDMFAIGNPSAFLPQTKTKAGSKRLANEVDSDVAANTSPAYDVHVLSRKTQHDSSLKPFVNVKASGSIRFTSQQANAILSGSLKGLTLIAGVPGSGKTSVAARIAANIFQGYPTQRILVVSPTQQHLIRLLGKMVEYGVEERYVISLSHGFGELRADSDEALGKLGRINHLLSRRSELLSQVDHLAKSLGIEGEHGSSCETAQYFFSFHVIPLWAEFFESVKSFSLTTSIMNQFPFSKFFTTYRKDKQYAQLLLESSLPATALDAVKTLYAHIEAIFSELTETQALELLRSRKDRADYIISKQARVIGVTSLDAPLKSRELARLGFYYQNVVVDDAHQLMETEMLTALLLNRCRKGSASGDIATAGGGPMRIVMIGDIVQLPPLVRRNALRNYANLDQSMFYRLVKLGVPTIELTEQRRSRPSIAKLSASLYPSMSYLSDSQISKPMRLANPGFAFDSQLVNVEDFLGQGETMPRKDFFQNLGEAEYLVAVFQYMRLIGYPSSKIAILTPYKGQKELIQDVLIQRCSWNPVFGKPQQIATIDGFRDGVADIVLLSLVRTRTMGAMADVHKLVSSISSARLGLYIFCRVSAYTSDTGPFAELEKRQTDLCLCVNEKYDQSFCREVGHTGMPDDSTGDTSDAPSGNFSAVVMDGVEHMGKYVYQMAQEQMTWLQRQTTTTTRGGANRHKKHSGRGRK